VRLDHIPKWSATKVDECKRRHASDLVQVTQKYTKANVKRLQNPNGNLHYLPYSVNRGRSQERKTNRTRASLPGDHRELEPPDPIPNSEVKRLIANGSVRSPHARVGHRQASIPKTPNV
jgi:hypothetical protein